MIDDVYGYIRYQLVKNQNESLTRRKDDDTADKAATEDGYKNSEAISADNTEEGMSHSSIVTSECVAYHSTVHDDVNRNLSQTSERVDSVVYDVPFSVY